MTKLNLRQKFVTSVATVAILANGLTPLAFADEYVISGNGAGSDNWITTSQTSTTVVAQNNVANVTNDVDANAKTGYNDAYKNTGGDVTIKTGNASADVS